jgi:hypothetical protein
MKFNTRLFIAMLKARKEGIIIGALAGAGLAYYAISQGYTDLSQVVSAGEGFLDSLMGRNAVPMDIAKYKVYGVFITFGGILGYYLDMIYDKIGLPRRGRRRR